MVLPFPKRIPTKYVLIVAALLMMVLLAEGNDVVACLAVAGTLVIGGFAFNVAGGIRSPTGSYVLFAVLFTGTVGAVVKAVLGQPLEDNATDAGKTLTVYFAGTCALLIAVLVSRRLIRPVPLLAGKLNAENTSRIVIGCLAGGIGLPILINLTLGAGNGSLAGVIRQLNAALPLSTLIAVYHRTISTKGRSCFSWPALIGAAVSTSDGIFGFSKEGIFIAPAAWLLAAAAGGYRMSLQKMAVVGTAALFAVLVLVPYAQYGRTLRGTADSFDTSIKLLEHPWQTRQFANEYQKQQPPELYHWFHDGEGILDRLTFVPIDSALIARTDKTGTLGLRNLYLYFENIVPHFLLADKPEIATGNQYAHEIGMLAPADNTTGISFSPFSESYHLLGWTGVLLVYPAVILVMFVILDSVSGNTDQSPWGLFYIVNFIHRAAEGSLQQPIYAMSFGTEALIATTLFMVYVTPIFGALLVGPERVAVRRIRKVTGIARPEANPAQA